MAPDHPRPVTNTPKPASRYNTRWMVERLFSVRTRYACLSWSWNCLNASGTLIRVTNTTASISGLVHDMPIYFEVMAGCR